MCFFLPCGVYHRRRMYERDHLASNINQICFCSSFISFSFAGTGRDALQQQLRRQSEKWKYVVIKAEEIYVLCGPQCGLLGCCSSTHCFSWRRVHHFFACSIFIFSLATRIMGQLQCFSRAWMVSVCTLFFVIFAQAI